MPQAIRLTERGCGRGRGEREGCPGQRNDSPGEGGIRAATGRRGQGERETTRGSPAARAKAARDTATIPRRRRAKALRAIYAKGGRVGLHRGGRGKVVLLLPFSARRRLGVRTGGAAACAAGTGRGELPPAAAQREEQRDGEQQKHPRVAPGHATLRAGRRTAAGHKTGGETGGFPRIRKAPTGARPGTPGRTLPTRGTAQTR